MEQVILQRGKPRLREAMNLDGVALPSCHPRVNSAGRHVERKWLPQQRSDVNHPLLLVALRDSFPHTHLKVSCPVFLYSSPSSAKDCLRACFHPSPRAGKHQTLFRVGLVGVKGGFCLQSLSRTGGAFYFLLSHKNALREIVFLFLILQMRKLQLRKAKPPTQGHTACEWGSWGSNQSLGYPMLYLILTIFYSPHGMKWK